MVMGGGSKARSNLRIISGEEELRAYFNQELIDLDYDLAVKVYVSHLMTDFACEKGNRLLSILSSENLERVQIQKSSSEGNFNYLKDMGDVFLWMCGFFPEHVTEKRKNRPRFSLTLEDYVQYGRSAYYQASNLFKGGELPIKEIARNFPWVAQSILNLRGRMNPNLRYLLHGITISEIERVLNEGQSLFEEVLPSVFN